MVVLVGVDLEFSKGMELHMGGELVDKASWGHFPCGDLEEVGDC